MNSKAECFIDEMFSRDFDFIINEVLSQELKILERKEINEGAENTRTINQILPLK